MKTQNTPEQSQQQLQNHKHITASTGTPLGTVGAVGAMGAYVKQAYDKATSYANQLISTGLWWPTGSRSRVGGSGEGVEDVPEIQSIGKMKPIIEKSLAAFVDSKYDQYTKISDQTYVWSAFDHTRKIIIGGGKRARPYLAYLSYMTYCHQLGIYSEVPVDRLIGLELFHIFALMHDDIIDKSTSRHGVTTLHEQQKDALLTQKQDIRAVSHEHIAGYGTSQAILVGDIIFSWAFESLLLSSSHGSDETAAMHTRSSIFHQMIDEVVIGQMIDVSIGLRKSVTEKDLEEKNRLKSARYSFVMPLRIGMALAQQELSSAVANSKSLSNASKRTMYYEQRPDAHYSQLTSFFERVGLALGLAFQIQDDMLDIIGDTQKTGKPILLDVEAGQHTYLSNYVLAQGSDSDKIKLLSCFGKNLSETDRHDLLIIFKNSGALDHGQRLVSHYIAEAEELIRAQSFGDAVKTAWLDLVGVVAQRKK